MSVCVVPLTPPAVRNNLLMTVLEQMLLWSMDHLTMSLTWLVCGEDKAIIIITAATFVPSANVRDTNK